MGQPMSYLPRKDNMSAELEPNCCLRSSKSIFIVGQD
jgi:hypothetical protein